MPNQREIDYIINLRNSTKNSSEAKKLDRILEQLYQNTKKVNEAFITSKTVNQITVLRKAIDKVTGSLQKFLSGRESGFKNLQKGIASVLDIINKLIEASKRGKGELGKFARDNLGDISDLRNVFINLEHSLQKVSEAVSDFSKKSQKSSVVTFSLSSALKSQESALNRAASEYQYLIDKLYSYNAAGKKSVTVTNKLEAILQKIQVLGKFKGTSLFEQNVKSTKAFISELEKLRLKLAEVNREPVFETVTVSKDMILEFRRLSEAIGIAYEKTKLLRKSFNDLKKGDDPSEAIQRLRTVLSEMGVSVGEGVTSINSFEKAVNKAMRKIKNELDSNKITWRELVALQTQAIDNMRKNLTLFAQTSFKTWAGVKNNVEGTYAVFSEANAKVMALSTAFNKFRAAERELRAGTISMTTAQEAANEVIKKADVVISSLGPKYRKNALLAKELASSFLGIANLGEYLQNRMKTLATSLVDLSRREKALTTASKYLADSQGLLRQQTTLAQERAALFNAEIIKLSARLNILKSATTKDEKAISVLSKRLEVLQIQAKKASDNFTILNNRLLQAEQKVGDASRAISRMSSQGFANMIISQAAWMAGFQLIFGTLDRFKAAMMAVLETQLAVARAMRTVRSETKSSAEIYDELTNAVNKMRMEIGSAATETGEALYQLGSAGLNLDETLAALPSTMDTIVGSEADMAQITNLVAGIYNNFGNQIVKINGQVRTVSRTFDDYGDNLVEAASLTEKFQRINDLLVRTFDAHQAEMDQIRDGLKFMAQSANQANLSLTEQLGILAVLHDHFIKAGAAGRGMRVVISRISKEAEKFAEAFDLDIDLSAPIDMIDIFRQLHNQLKNNLLSVEKLGIFFKRLGLRGIEPLLVLIQNFDELTDVIQDLTENSEGASKAMRLMRLANLGDQAKIAGGKIEVLIKSGLDPLAKLLGLSVAGFNKIADAIVAANDSLGGFLGILVKLGGFLGTISLMTVLWKNHGSMLSWVANVFRKLWKNFKDFGELSSDTEKTVITLGGSFGTLKDKASGFFSKLKKGYVDQKNFNKGMLGMGSASATFNAAVTTLTGTVGKLSLAMKGLIIVAAAFAFYKLIDYIGETNNRLRALVKTQLDKLRIDQKRLKVFEEEVNSLQKVSEVTNENKQQVLFLAQASGVYAKTTEDLSNKLEIIKERSKELLVEQQKLFDSQKAVFFANQMTVIKEDLKDINLYGKAGVSIWVKIWEAIKGIAAYVPIINLIPGAFKELVNIGKVVAHWFTTLLDKIKLATLWLGEKLTRKVDSLREKFKDAFPTVSKFFGLFKDDSEEAIEAFMRLQERVSKLGVKVSEYEKQLRAAKIALKYAADEEQRLAARELINRIRALIKMTKDQIAGVEKEIETNKRSLKLSKLYQLALQRLSLIKKDVIQDTSDLKKTEEEWEKAAQKNIKTVALFSYALARLRLVTSKAADEYSDFMNKLDKKMALERFSMNVDELVRKLSNLKVSGPETFYDLLKASTKLANEGVNAMNSFRDSIRRLNDELARINESIDNLKTEKMNRGIDDAGTKVDNLMKRFEEAGKSIDRTSKSQEASTDITWKQRNILRKAVEAQKEQIDKIREAKDSLENNIQTTEKEIKARGKSKEALEKNRTSYNNLNKSVDELRKQIDKEHKANLRLIEIKLKLGRITENQAKRAYDKELIRYQKEIEKNAEAYNRIKENQIKNEELLAKKIRVSISDQKKGLDDLKLKVGELASAMSNIHMEIDTGAVYKKVKELINEADKLNKTLGKRIKKYVDIYYREHNKPSGGGKKYWGGEIKRAAGGIVPVRVTAGEGIVLPDKAQRNLQLLNAINRGSIVSKVPEISGMFKGPPGIDNIQTHLPAGSFIISKRGMEAYEKSVNLGAQTFQEGGEVLPETPPIDQSEPSQQSVGTFTIVVEKEGVSKSFPVTGKISVLQSLRDELEEDRLTRLH